MAGECAEEVHASSETSITAVGTDDMPVKPLVDGHVVEIPATSPCAPDRNLFQSSLSDINVSIEQNTRRLHHLVGRNGHIGMIAEASERKRAIRSKREALKKETDEVKAKLEEKIKGIEDLRKQMKLLEPDLQWRNMERLDKELKTFEEKYNSTKLNNREEKYVVAELDKLKRNKRRLEKYNILLGELRAIEADVSVLKLERDSHFNQQKALRKDEVAEAQTSASLREEARRCRQQLSELINERTSVVGQYEADRDAYAQWVRNNRKAALKASSSFPATFPSAHRNNADFVEVEELEPFYEQKRDCRLLISYLERYEKEQMDDSTEEYPEAFSRLAIQPVCRPKKKSHKKKNNQPLSHGIDIYKLFGQVEIDPPKYAAEVPVALDKVRAMLELHESHTVPMSWDEEQYGLGTIAAGTIARTMSTVDSAYDHCETLSMNSGRFALSPIMLSRRDSKRVSRGDEGLGSATSPLSPQHGSPV